MIPRAINNTLGIRTAIDTVQVADVGIYRMFEGRVFKNKVILPSISFSESQKTIWNADASTPIVIPEIIGISMTLAYISTPDGNQFEIYLDSTGACYLNVVGFVADFSVTMGIGV